MFVLSLLNFGYFEDDLWYIDICSLETEWNSYHLFYFEWNKHSDNKYAFLWLRDWSRD